MKAVFSAIGFALVLALLLTGIALTVMFLVTVAQGTTP